MKFYPVYNTCQYKVCGDGYGFIIPDRCGNLFALRFKKQPLLRVGSLDVDGISRLGCTWVWI